MPVELTSLARVHLLLVRHAERQGIGREELLRLAGLSEDLLEDPDARLPSTGVLRLWQLLVGRLRDPALGVHLLEGVQLRELGLVGYAMAFSPDLLDALRRLHRYVRILSETIQYDLTEGERLEVAARSNPRFVALRHPVDAALGIVIMAAREATGVHIVPFEVRLPYPRPERVDAHRRFFGPSVSFDWNEARVVFRPEDAARPVAAADRTLSRYLVSLAEELLGDLGRASRLTDRVRRALWHRLAAGPPSLWDIASELNVSTRSLQRGLQAEGGSFATVLDELRRETALRMIDDGMYAVYEIACVLGYAEPSSFFRAFRRWTGRSPREYQRDRWQPG